MFGEAHPRATPPPLPAPEDWTGRLDLRRVGGEWVGPCPACGGTDRFHVGRGRGGAARVGCRGCIDGEPEAVRREAFTRILREVFPERFEAPAPAPGGVRGPAHPATGFSPPRPVRRHTPDGPEAARDSLAARLWRTSGGPDLSPGRAYLALRRAWPPFGAGPDLPPSVAWLMPGAAPARDRAAKWPGLPPCAAGALVFAYRLPGEPDGPPRAVSLMAFDADGRRMRWPVREGLGPHVRMVGSRAGRVFEVGDPAGPELAIVEGEADALAVAAGWRVLGFARPPLVRAGGSTSGLTPDACRDEAARPVAVLPDRDGPGVKAAGELAADLRARGRAVRIVRRPAPAPGNPIDPDDPAAEVAWRWWWRAMGRGGGPAGEARAWRWLLSGSDPEGAAA